MLKSVSPDVVHITTPPKSHHELGVLCIEHGANVYMEKPFTVTATETEDLIQRAQRSNVLITVGHNAQFTHAAQRMRRKVAEGYLGGPPVHMEAYYCYNLGDERYARALLGDGFHWVRDLPGQLFHNIISHGISKLAEFLVGSDFDISTTVFQSTLLKDIGEQEIMDEMRVTIRDEEDRTATFVFSTTMSPKFHLLRLYGPSNGLEVNDDTQALICLGGKSYKSYLNQFLPHLGAASQNLNNFFWNAGRFLVRDFHTGHGMGYLISAFYRSIMKGDPVPIPYSEILATARIMDSMFQQMSDSRLQKQKRHTKDTAGVI